MKTQSEKFDAHVKQYYRTANIIARRDGYSIATKILRGPDNKVIEHISYGYRKYTTGEYVPNAYRDKFGWKNTYYQHAETIVMVRG